MYRSAAHHAGGIGYRGAAETVGKNLIAHAPAKPVRHRICGVIDGELITAQLPILAVQTLQPEGIPDQAHIVPHLQRGGKDVYPPVGICPDQRNVSGAAVVKLIFDHQRTSGKPLASLGTKGKFHRCARRHRAVGALVVQAAGIENLVIVHTLSNSFDPLFSLLKGRKPDLL